jgi:hypothetical protein
MLQSWGEGRQYTRLIDNAHWWETRRVQRYSVFCSVAAKQTLKTAYIPNSTTKITIRYQESATKKTREHHEDQVVTSPAGKEYEDVKAAKHPPPIVVQKTVLVQNCEQDSH